MDMETGTNTEMEEKQEMKRENLAESGQSCCTWDSPAHCAGLPEMRDKRWPMIPVQPGFTYGCTQDPTNAFMHCAV